MKVFFRIAVLTQFLLVQFTPIFAQDSPVNWAKISDAVYSMDYPENWEVNKTSDIGINLLAMSPLDKGGDKFRENLTVVVQELKANETAETLGRATINEIVSLLDDANLVSQEYVSNDGNPYFKGVYTGVQYDMQLRYEQRYFSKDNRAYIIVIACEADSYEKYEADFERMLGSFTFLD